MEVIENQTQNRRFGNPAAGLSAANRVSDIVMHRAAPGNRGIPDSGGRFPSFFLVAPWRKVVEGPGTRNDAPRARLIKVRGPAA